MYACDNARDDNIVTPTACKPDIWYQVSGYKTNDLHGVSLIWELKGENVALDKRAHGQLLNYLLSVLKVQERRTMIYGILSNNVNIRFVRVRYDSKTRKLDIKWSKSYNFGKADNVGTQKLVQLLSKSPKQLGFVHKTVYKIAKKSYALTKVISDSQEKHPANIFQCCSLEEVEANDDVMYVRYVCKSSPKHRTLQREANMLAFLNEKKVSQVPKLVAFESRSLLLTTPCCIPFLNTKMLPASFNKLLELVKMLKIVNETLNVVHWRVSLDHIMVSGDDCVLISWGGALSLGSHTGMREIPENFMFGMDDWFELLDTQLTSYDVKPHPAVDLVALVKCWVFCRCGRPEEMIKAYEIADKDPDALWSHFLSVWNQMATRDPMYSRMLNAAKHSNYEAVYNIGIYGVAGPPGEFMDSPPVIKFS